MRVTGFRGAAKMRAEGGAERAECGGVAVACASATLLSTANDNRDNLLMITTVLLCTQPDLKFTHQWLRRDFTPG